MARFSGKVALVVGGNSGIGLAAARQLADEGAQCIITGRDAATLKAAEAAIPGLRAFESDIADPSNLAPVISSIRDSHGRIDALFVNAGGGKFQPVRAVTIEDWDKLHDINLRGCFFAIQKALPLMGPGGSIVLTGSISASLGAPATVAYASSKAGLRAVARVLAAELVGEGIRVNMVSPGPTETPIMGRHTPGEAGLDAMRKHFSDMIPMKRLGRPEEIAKAMLFLASDEASFITGIDLAVDGGALEL